MTDKRERVLEALGWMRCGAHTDCGTWWTPDNEAVNNPDPFTDAALIPAMVEWLQLLTEAHYIETNVLNTIEMHWNCEDREWRLDVGSESVFAPTIQAALAEAIYMMEGE